MKDFLRNNGVLLLIIALLLAGVTAVVSVTLGGSANPIASFFGWVTTPVRNGVDALAGWVEGIYDDSFRRESLEEEVERLRQEVARLQEEVRQSEDAILENENLRSLLGLAQKRKDFVFESVTVTAHATSNWDSTLTISKGSNHDIAAGDCVVDPYGNLVGVVSEVGPNYAVVATLIDSGTDMGGMLSRTNTAAILEGDFALMGQGRLKLSYLAETAEVIAGDEVITSGLGGVYPSGLVVGSVASIHTDDAGMNRYAVIIPAADLEEVDQLFVIKDFDIVE